MKARSIGVDVSRRPRPAAAARSVGTRGRWTERRGTAPRRTTAAPTTTTTTRVCGKALSGRGPSRRWTIGDPAGRCRSTGGSRARVAAGRTGVQHLRSFRALQTPLDSVTRGNSEAAAWYIRGGAAESVQAFAEQRGLPAPRRAQPLCRRLVGRPTLFEAAEAPDSGLAEAGRGVLWVDPARWLRRRCAVRQGYQGWWLWWRGG